MKYLLPVITFLLLVSCKNYTEPDVSMNNSIIRDSVSTYENTLPITDTIVKISEPFILNRILCYWKHTLVVYGGEGYDTLMELKDYNSERLLFSWEYAPELPEDFNLKAYFNTINKNFIDVNFDGYKDIAIYSEGSIPMTSKTNIYVFNANTKTFDSEEDLSDRIIEDVDSINKILTTSSFDWEATYEKRYHFDKKGKIRYVEEISYRPLDTDYTISLGERVYQKIIKGKVVKTKIDTIPY